ncbi:MAG: hypothetical protein JW843_00630 [Candidatus Aminicenantes bacterium]|nr:hypothetical protein [Candidatus Aminicenantes bacterium]
MNIKIPSIVLLLISAGPLAAGVYPQAGIEYYSGSNSLALLTPWVAARFSLAQGMSLIFKYYDHNMRYDYQGYDEAAEEFVNLQRKTHTSNLTTVLYAQKGKWTGYAAVSFMFGTDGYRATAFDGGLGFALTPKLTVEAGVYLLREDSVLWFPEDPVRKINLYSVKANIKYKILPWLTLNPNIYLYRNSEDVEAVSWSAGIILTPFSPLAVTAYYFKYSESAQYKFSGDYLSVGLNLYF